MDVSKSSLINLFAKTRFLKADLAAVTASAFALSTALAYKISRLWHMKVYELSFILTGGMVRNKMFWMRVVE